MKRIAIMQPYLFPYLGYFQVMNAVDTYVVYDDVNFIKGGWINRNSILLQGARKNFCISLAGASPNKMIRDINIVDDFRIFLEMVRHAYARAPFFASVWDLLRSICSCPDKNLANFAVNSFLQIQDYLKRATPIIMSSKIEKNNDLRSEEKILHLCELLQADMYVNAIGGRALYRTENFSARRVALRFLRSCEISYPQNSAGFVSDLSIIDVLMFNDVRKVNTMLEAYELVV
jgi:hypothetical protein